MEDSSAMTIEFLRARLLSERSVSRSARQRVHELEKMVYFRIWESVDLLMSGLLFKELSLSLSLVLQYLFCLQFR